MSLLSCLSSSPRSCLRPFLFFFLLPALLLVLLGCPPHQEPPAAPVRSWWWWRLKQQAGAASEDEEHQARQAANSKEQQWRTDHPHPHDHGSAILNPQPSLLIGVVWLWSVVLVVNIGLPKKGTIMSDTIHINTTTVLASARRAPPPLLSCLFPTHSTRSPSKD